MRILALMMITSLIASCLQPRQPRPEIAKLVKAMSKHKRYDDEFIGYSMETTDQYRRFIELSKIATDQELFLLTDHDSPAVRVYAFRALSQRKDIPLFPAIVKHIHDHDSLFVTQGCFISKDAVGDFMMELVGPPYYFDNQFRFTDEQMMVVDSMLQSVGKGKKFNHLNSGFKNESKYPFMAVAPPTSSTSNTSKPILSFIDIINMNVGFFGIQYSFGLQQSAVNPIYDMLGAAPHEIPLLNLAGPVTGLIVQPIIGAMSDRTWSQRWGRRKPYFLIGAIICSIALFLYPFSSSLWMAAGLLWILLLRTN
jgi:hypothetical protein